MNLVHIGVAFGLMSLGYCCVAYPSGQLSDKFVSIDGNAIIIIMMVLSVHVDA